MLPAIHSVPAMVGDARCETVPSLPAASLRPYVAGYAGFRAGAGGSPWHRILPLNHTVLILDFDGGGSLLTGPRDTALLWDRSTWRYGVTVGLTPAGSAALLAVPPGALVGEVLPLAAVLGGGADRLAGHLAGLPDWPSRFRALDAWSTAALRTDRRAGGRRADELITSAWSRLQRPGDPVTVGALAARLGVSPRYLQIGFRRQIGLSPKTVARIARFQRAVVALAEPAASVATAAAHGYCDQAHFHRETRAMAGVTPGELFAFLQYAGRPAG